MHPKLKAAWPLPVLAYLALTSCAPADIREEGAACQNRRDDDGDGQTDCDDPGCAAFCEQTEAACTNELDDDGDGKTDCESGSCRAAGFCEARLQACDVLAQTGCPRGLACIAKEFKGIRCGVAGSSPTNGACAVSDDCAQPATCTSNRRCGRLCAVHADCPRSSACGPSIDGASICLLGCVPAEGARGCASGTHCETLESFGEAVSGGTYAACVAATGNYGSAAEGASCDAVPGTDLTRRCGPLLVCMRGAPGAAATCHATCGLDSATGTVVVACKPGSSCVRAFDDLREPLFGALDLGICR